MSFKFLVGKWYTTQAGDLVQIVGRFNTAYAGYETVLGSDGTHRYDRSTHSQDAGRVTGSSFGYTHPANFRVGYNPELKILKEGGIDNA